MEILKRNSTLINQKYSEYFWPTVMTAMASNIAIIVDGTIVGNMLDGNSLAAVNILSPVIQLYFALCILIGLSTSTMIAKAKGDNDSKAANKFFTTGMASLLLISAILMIIQFIFLDKIIGIFTNSAELKPLVLAYYVPVIIATPITLLLDSGVFCLRVDNRPKFASNIIIIANVINLIMDVILMGPMRMGIAGASWATIIGNAVAVVLMVSHLFSKKNTLKFDLGVLKIKEFFNHLGALISMGLSGTLGTLLMTVRMFFLNSIIQKYGGESAIIAYSVVSMCLVFVSAFITGASQTMVPLVGMLSGENDHNGIKYTVRRAILILFVSTTVIIAVVEMIPGVIAGLYGIEKAADLAMADVSLRVVSLSFMAQSFVFLALYYYMSVGKKFISTTISVLNGVGFIIPFGLLFGYLWGIDGIWWSINATQYGTLLVALAIPFVILNKEKDKYESIYLLDKNLNNEILSFSYSAADTDKENIAVILNEMKNKTNEKVADTVGEILQKIVNANVKKNLKNNSDIRINSLKDGYLIMIKNNGAIIDDFSEQNVLKDLKANVRKFEYYQTLGLNQIRIET